MDGYSGWWNPWPGTIGGYLQGYAKAAVYGSTYDQLRLEDTIHSNGWNISFSGYSPTFSLGGSNDLIYNSGWQHSGYSWTVNYTGIRFEGWGVSMVDQTATGTYRKYGADYIASTWGYID